MKNNYMSDSSQKKLRHFDELYPLHNLEKEQKRRIQILLDKRAGPYANSIGELLEVCVETSPCTSRACPICNQRFSLTLYNSIKSMAKKYSVRQFVTIIFFDRIPNKVSVQDIKALNQRLYRILTKAGFNSPVLGSIEFDWLEVDNGWSLHCHLIILGNDTQLLNKQLAKLRKSMKRTVVSYRRNGGGRTGVLRSMLNITVRSREFITLVAYMFKTHAVEWTSSHRRTDKPLLTGSKLVTALIVAHDAENTKLVFTYRCRLVNNVIYEYKNCGRG